MGYRAGLHSLVAKRFQVVRSTQQQPQDRYGLQLLRKSKYDEV
ncbi:hypothetical protein SDC9_128744 [bioreactor metagenome]|uniref:Uncharacterized protein n=1 Tax=bioreactor metagenome TaxID=1076179 RepID=A0A645CXR5_9ZZZZ